MAVTHAAPKNPAIAALVAGRNRDPFAVLGPHVDESGAGMVVRAFQPAAQRIDVLVRATGAAIGMTKQHPTGVFEARLKSSAIGDVAAPGLLDYRLRLTYPRDHVVEVDDPYRYGRVLSDFDMHLLGEGRHYRVFEKLGSHRITIGST